MQSNGLINVATNFDQHIERLNSGLLNFVVNVPAQIMPHAQEGLKRHQRQKTC